MLTAKGRRWVRSIAFKLRARCRYAPWDVMAQQPLYTAGNGGAPSPPMGVSRPCRRLHRPPDSRYTNALYGRPSRADAETRLHRSCRPIMLRR